MKVILIGYGNVGKELRKILQENKTPVDFIVRSDGIYDSQDKKVDGKENFSQYIDDQSVVFISLPSKDENEEISGYYFESLKKGASVVTCEKAFLAYHWNVVDRYKGKIKYSATVGGNSGMLNAISGYLGEIEEIKAVINGTLNYVADRLAEGCTKESVFKEVVEKGFAEPGSQDFDQVIKNETKDVLYKTAILANHSKLHKNIFKPQDFLFQKYKDGLRCAVLINREEVQLGFTSFEDTAWFPAGVNNALYINGKKIVEGPGAGAQITAQRMLTDFKEFGF